MKNSCVPSMILYSLSLSLTPHRALGIGYKYNFSLLISLISTAHLGFTHGTNYKYSHRSPSSTAAELAPALAPSRWPRMMHGCAIGLEERELGAKDEGGLGSA